MQEQSWSPAEKQIARAAFDKALRCESEAVRREVESMLDHTRDAQVVWRIEDYLRERRREFAEKYDFRYSRLLLIFARLYHEGWLSEQDLAGLAPDKVQFITRRDLR
jgi:hypothetical protein